MEDQTGHVSYKSEQIEAEIDVRRADVISGVKRTRLQNAAKKIAEGQELEIDEWIALTVVWPDVMSCTKGTIRQEFGVPMTWSAVDWEAFKDLPDDFVLSLANAVYKHNPHWSTDGDTDAATVEKKSEATTS
jgi:hypothetical protein